MNWGMEVDWGRRSGLGMGGVGLAVGGKCEQGLEEGGVAGVGGFGVDVGVLAGGDADFV